MLSIKFPLPGHHGVRGPCQLHGAARLHAIASTSLECLDGQIYLTYTQCSTVPRLCLLVMGNELIDIMPVARAHAGTGSLTRASGRTGAWARYPPLTSITVKAPCAAVGALPSLPRRHLDALAANMRCSCSCAWRCELASLPI